MNYTNKHKILCKVIRQNPEKVSGTHPVYRHKPRTVLDRSAYSMYRAKQELTDHHKSYNKPDVLVDGTGLYAYIIDVAVQCNIERKYAEKEVTMSSRAL